MREAERTAAGEYSAPQGDLIVTAPIVFGRLHVLPVVVEFLKVYPDIDIRGSGSDHAARHADAAARLEQKPTDDLARYDLKEALQFLAKILIDYRVRP